MGAGTKTALPGEDMNLSDEEDVSGGEGSLTI